LPLDANANKPSAPPGAKMQTALRAARNSPNRVRQVGAVLVARDGTEIAACNTFPTGIRDLDERHAGDGRFVWMEHAERHTIFAAARRGGATAGAHITSTFFPCIDCARAIVEAGIVCLDTPAPAFDDPVWGASFERSQIILREGGVEIRLVEAVDRS
jgi:dCMP deaminase